MGRRARAQTPPQHRLSTQPQLPPQWAGLGDTRLTGPSQISSNPSRPSPTRPAHTHDEHSPSPTPSSYNPGFTRAPAHENRQGIAPQPMRYTFTHPGGWPDRLQRTRTRGSVGSTTRARTTSRPPEYLGSTPSQERLGKRKRPTSAERSTVVPQTTGTVGTQRETAVGPQRSHRRHHNVAEKTHSTMLPSGGMYMTFPLDIPSPEPDIEGGAPAGPPPFAHGPTELPPRPYETHTAEEGSGPERPAKRGRLPADVMDHLPKIEGRLHKIEVAVQDYLDTRNKRALDKSMLPGSQ